MTTKVDLLVPEKERATVHQAIDAAWDDLELPSSLTEGLMPHRLQAIYEIRALTIALRDALSGCANDVATALVLFDNELDKPGEAVSRTAQALCTIVDHRCFRGWSRRQQTYFVDTAIDLADRYDFFLSFSNRPYKAEPDSVLDVNYHNKNFIKSVLSDVGRSRWSTENLVAPAVLNIIESYSGLRSHGLRGYYYPAHEGNGATIKEKIVSALERSRAFVQVLHNEMFVGAKENNFCCFEFEMSLKRQLPEFYIHAIPSTERTPPEGVSVLYQPWMNRVADIGALELAPTVQNISGVVGAMRKRVLEAVASGVAKARQDLIDRAPLS